MTNREFYVAVMALENVTDEIKEFAEAAVEKMDATNSARQKKTAEKAAERNAERQPLIDALMRVMTHDAKTATTLIEEAGLEIKPQLVPSLMKALIADGTVMKGEVKVTGRGKQVGYCLPTASEEEEADTIAE